MIPGNIHYESIVSGILLILLCFVMLGRVIRFPYKRALVGLQLGLFGIWMGYFLGWTMIHGEIWSEFVAVSAGMWGTSAFVGFIILYIRSLQPQR